MPHNLSIVANTCEGLVVITGCFGVRHLVGAHCTGIENLYRMRSRIAYTLAGWRSKGPAGSGVFVGFRGAEVQIALAAVHDGAAGFGGPPPTGHGGHLTLKFLVNGEEVLNLAANVREDLIHGVDLVVTWVAGRDREDLLVRLGAIDHVEHADGANFNQHTRKAGLLNEDEAIEGIVVIGKGAGDEAVVAGVVERRIERAIEPENAQFTVIFVLIGGVLGNLNDATDYFRGIGAGIKIVESGHGFSVTREPRL